MCVAFDRCSLACSVRATLWRLCRGFNYLLVLSCLFALAEATVFPLVCVVLAEVAVIALDPQHNYDTVAFWVGMFAVIGVGNVACSSLRILMAELHGARVTATVSIETLRRIINHSSSWFDVIPSASASVQSLLVRDCPVVRHMLADRASILTLSAFTLVFGAVVGMYSCYQVTLLIVAFLPLSVMTMVLSTTVGLWQ